MEKALFEKLPLADQELIDSLRTKMIGDDGLVGQVCSLVKKDVNDGTVVDFDSLEPVERTNACLGYVGIGLVSGTVHRGEVESLIKGRSDQENRA
ncbi:MAG: hypothetical protein HQ536_02370 [Parcubacteria group bacterium]|nr:hypothetical protein [Parcubacteria group bacterium]